MKMRMRVRMMRKKTHDDPASVAQVRPFAGRVGARDVPARKATWQHLPCAASLAAVLLAGCNVGPKYVKPAAPAPPEFKESAPAKYTNTPPGAWQPASPQDAELKGKWWTIFHSPELNALEDQLNINNQNIAQYFQNFMAARAMVSQARSRYFPTVTGGFGASGSKVPAAELGGGGVASSTAGVTGGNYSLPFDVSWEPDLWGQIRNTVHEAEYATQVSAAELENERLTEQADLAEVYFELRGQDALQDLFNQTVAADKKTLELTQALYSTGIVDDESVAEAEITLENDTETSTGIATNRALYEHAIAMLIGQPASSFSLPVKPLTTTAPAIPVGLPSQLLERRPDVAGAERTMAEANALIGIEKAAYYPSVSLTGTTGFESATIGKLLSVPAMFWSAGESATETIFDAGLIKATVAQYRAEYNADVANYRQTVLTAFQQVENYIATIRITSVQIQQETASVRSAQRYLDSELSRYQTGLDPYLDVVTAQTTLLSDQQQLMTLRVSEMTAAVELVQALGGGWNANQLPAANKVTSKAAARQVAATQ